MQLRDIMPAALASLAMAACVWPVTLLGLHDILTLMIQVPLGVVVYVLISVVFKLDSFNFMLGVVKKLLHRG